MKRPVIDRDKAKKIAYDLQEVIGDDIEPSGGSCQTRTNSSVSNGR